MITESIEFTCDLCGLKASNEFVQHTPIDQHKHQYLQTLPRNWTLTGQTLACYKHTIVTNPQIDLEPSFVSYRQYCNSTPKAQQ